jgi:hypothetical protein
VLAEACGTNMVRLVVSSSVGSCTQQYGWQNGTGQDGHGSLLAAQKSNYSDSCQTSQHDVVQLGISQLQRARKTCAAVMHDG